MRVGVVTAVKLSGVIVLIDILASLIEPSRNAASDMAVEPRKRRRFSLICCDMVGLYSFNTSPRPDLKAALYLSLTRVMIGLPFSTM